MSNHSHQETKGKQAFLFGNASLGGTLLITLVFLLNAALVLLADNFLIHPVPCDETHRPVLEGRIPGEVLDMEPVTRGYLILYRTPEGEAKIAVATSNTMGRYRLKLDAYSVSGESDSYDSATLDFTIQDGQITRASRIYPISSIKTSGGLILTICFLLTALERMLFQKLRGQ